MWQNHYIIFSELQILIDKTISNNKEIIPLMSDGFFIYNMLPSLFNMVNSVKHYSEVINYWKNNLNNFIQYQKHYKSLTLKHDISALIVLSIIYIRLTHPKLTTDDSIDQSVEVVTSFMQLCTATNIPKFIGLLKYIQEIFVFYDIPYEYLVITDKRTKILLKNLFVFSSFKDSIYKGQDKVDYPLLSCVIIYDQVQERDQICDHDDAFRI